MTDHVWPALLSRQFAAALRMLQQAIEACPDNLWDDRSQGSPFWHLAYHALFFTDLYLSDDLEDFQARDFHEENTHFLPGDYGDFAGIVTTPEKAYTRAQLAEYAGHCLHKAEEKLETLTDERALQRCGFEWYELNLGEFTLNNLRHLQQHTGQVILMLRRHADIGIEWMGTKDNQPPPPTW